MVSSLKGKVVTITSDPVELERDFSITLKIIGKTFFKKLLKISSQPSIRFFAHNCTWASQNKYPQTWF